MSIVLQPKKDLKSLLTISTNKQYRINRLKSDLDKSFIEINAQQQAAEVGLPYIDLYGFPVDTTHLSVISKEDVERVKLGAFSLSNNQLFLATNEPNYPGQEKIISDLVAQGFQVKLYLCSSYSMDKLLKSFEHLHETGVSDDSIVISQEKIDSMKGSIDNLQGLQEILQTASMTSFMETILSAAIVNYASDIHFEPEKDGFHIRLRLDGVLYTFATLTADKQKTIESRIKLLAGVKLNIDNVPQDGRFSFKSNNNDVDVRVSMLPSNYGYSIVMRLLGTGDVNLNLKDLGFTGINKDRVESAINKPQGLILTTGPTGSGKTTTLYTFLSELNDGSSKIITLEDPIEYKLQGISQTQIDTQSGFTFSSGLRSILRQDPDILMVGEIRDSETADIAVQASLTGHQVLSTIHTNDAAGAVPRMLEMGIKGFILADALEIIIGQRLIRKLCQNCKEQDPLTDEQKALILKQIGLLPQQIKDTLPDNVVFYTSKGCDKCNNIGYKGRVGVYEVMSMTDGLRTLLSSQSPSIVQIRNIAMAEGMVTMLQDGILKALDGTTDIKELMRNVQY